VVIDQRLRPGVDDVQHFVVLGAVGHQHPARRSHERQAVGHALTQGPDHGIRVQVGDGDHEVGPGADDLVDDRLRARDVGSAGWLVVRQRQIRLLYRRAEERILEANAVGIVDVQHRELATCGKWVRQLVREDRSLKRVRRGDAIEQAVDRPRGVADVRDLGRGCRRRHHRDAAAQDLVLDLEHLAGAGRPEHRDGFVHAGQDLHRFVGILLGGADVADAQRERRQRGATGVDLIDAELEGLDGELVVAVLDVDDGADDDGVGRRVYRVQLRAQPVGGRAAGAQVVRRAVKLGAVGGRAALGVGVTLVEALAAEERQPQSQTEKE
jgi:hypothetical protein